MLICQLTVQSVVVSTNFEGNQVSALSAADLELWRSFRRAYEQANAAIERDLASATQLSGADHGILSRLAESEEGTLRQQELAGLMRWDRTRLSHYLTRMERRGLVERVKLEGRGICVRVIAAGDRSRKAADPVHADAVMRRFVLKLTAAQREAIASLAASLHPIDKGFHTTAPCPDDDDDGR